MEFNEIKALLEKYWNGETTLEEEIQLRDWFATHETPAEFQEVASLFRYFDQQRQLVVSTGFDEELRKKIKPRGALHKLYYNSMRIAAGLAVVVASVWFISRELRSEQPIQSGTELKDTYDDPKLAFEETKKALKMISRSFGKAEEKARNINMFNVAKSEIQKENKDSL